LFEESNARRPIFVAENAYTCNQSVCKIFGVIMNGSIASLSLSQTRRVLDIGLWSLSMLILYCYKPTIQEI